jgi:hypothetical protein
MFSIIVYFFCLAQIILAYLTGQNYNPRNWFFKVKNTLATPKNFTKKISRAHGVTPIHV